ncbi:MAG: prepilin-type N-terminal cleavage/methylation domain-containing protein [Planctomycetota bacterium]|nr:prepilin-type N-terminal cleavage/methylation domain-containing protein [Planctomycetota bacterium]
MSPRRGGFTLIELMVVVTIIGILIGLMFPIYSTAVRTVQEATCQDNLAQLAKVITAYCEANNGFFPFAGYKGTDGTYTTNPSAADWLYIGDTPNKTDLSSRTTIISGRAGEMQEGLLVKNKLIGKLESFYCPTDWDQGLVRGPASQSITPSGDRNLSGILNYAIFGTKEVRPATSYVINSAISFGESTPRRIHKLSDFGPSTFLFIEESSGDTEHGEKTSKCNRAFMSCIVGTADPGPRALTTRHRGGGYVACMDSHVEWLLPEPADPAVPDPNTFEATRTFTRDRTAAQTRDPTQWYFTTGTRWGP